MEDRAFAGGYAPDNAQWSVVAGLRSEAAECFQLVEQDSANTHLSISDIFRSTRTTMEDGSQYEARRTEPDRLYGDIEDVLQYDPAEGIYRLRPAELGEVNLSVAAVLAVMTVTDQPASAVVLNDVINPDGLDILFQDKHDGTPRECGRLTFTLAGCEVTVVGTEEITVVPPVD